MTELDRYRATLRISLGQGKALRSTRKQERIHVKTALGVLEDLRPIILELLMRREISADATDGTPKLAQYNRTTGNLLVATLLQALSAETALKLLYELENPKELAMNIHDLGLLFKHLSTETQDRLQSKYISRVSKYASSGLSDDVGDVFRTRANMFVLWRYMYEEGASGPGYSGELTLAIDAMYELVKELGKETIFVEDRSGAR